MVKEPVAGMYLAASPPLTVKPFWAPDSFEDALESSLFWSDHVEQAEQEEAAWATAPIAALPVPSMLRWVAFPPHSDSTDQRPILQYLDVITAVRGIHSGQAAMSPRPWTSVSGPTSVVTESWPSSCYTNGAETRSQQLPP